MALRCRIRLRPSAYIERYNRTVRHEWLDQHIIESIEEAQDFATQWLWTYNNDRPNMGIGGITPAQKLKMAAKVLRKHPVKNGGITIAIAVNLATVGPGLSDQVRLAQIFLRAQA